MAAIFSRIWPHLLAAAAIIGVLWYFDHRGYERAQADQAALERKVDDKIDEAVAAIDEKSAERIAGIHSTDKTVIQPIITRELASDPRYSDPRCSLTPGMFDGINRARALSGSAGANEGAMPAAGAAR